MRSLLSESSCTVDNRKSEVITLPDSKIMVSVVSEIVQYSIFTVYEFDFLPSTQTYQ